jgi:succinate-semialdehyde dehydrogenase/glutarate-semialdehyde dehydrogenase
MAVKGTIASKYRNAGQTCVCANRILVQDGVYDAFTRRLAETAGTMKVADGFEPGAVIGPLIDMKAVEKVEAHIADALKKGAKIVTGGKRAAQGGSFFEPTVLTDVTTDMVITKEETFGLVAPLYRFKSEDEAVKMANDTEFGLASYFYSRDIDRIWRVAEALEYGIVGINEGIISPKARWRDRALRRHEGKRHRPHLAGHWGSKYGIEQFLEIKYLCMGGIDR